MKKELMLLLILAIPFVSSYETGNVAYIVRFPHLYEHHMVDVLEDMNFTVNIVTEHEFKDLNLSKYKFIIVGDEILQHLEDIPVNNFPSMILNTWNIDDFHWAKHGSSYASSQPIDVLNNDDTHMITQGLNESFVVYTTAQSNGANLEVNFLSRYKKAPQIHSIVSTVINANDAVIATAVPGTKLRDNVISNSKGVFFGILHSDVWTDDAEQLFRNAVRWLLTDDTAPFISDIQVTPNETSAYITWKTDDNSNTTIYFGTNGLTRKISDSEFKKEHTTLLDNLNGSTLYYYKISACNNDGLCSSTDILNFSTLDLTPPEITNLQVKSVYDKGANITWGTDEIANSTVKCGINDTEFNLKFASSDFVLGHNIQLYGLDDNREYFCFVISCDESGNCNESGVFSFKTTDITPPEHVSGLKAFVYDKTKVRLQWDLVGDDDVITYNIYASENYSRFNFSQPAAVTTNNHWIDENAMQYSQRYYIVRAEDESGNEENNTNIVAKFDIAIEKGYNLISLPLKPFNSTIEAITYQDTEFHPITKIMEREDNGSYKEAVFNGHWITDDFDSLTPGKGYVAVSNQSYYLVTTGKLPELQQLIQISPGINLIGFSSLKALTLEKAFNTSLTEIFSRSGDECYSIARHYTESMGSYWWSADNLTELEPGKAYFVRASSPLNWVYESR